MIYLASPYSTGNGMSHEDNYNAVNECFIWLLKQWTPAPGIFCPIAHSHHQGPHLPDDHEWWLLHDVEFLKKCDELWICCLEGWRQSTGVLIERCVAAALDMPVKYVVKSGDRWIILNELPE